MRTLLRLGSLALFASFAFGAASLANGCTVMVNDDPLPDAADDAGDDTGADVADEGVDTTPTDGAVDAPAPPAVIVRANDLVGGASDDVRDYGGGSTFTDITVGGRIAYALAKYEAGTVKVESNAIGNAADGSGRVDGRLVGLPTDKGELTITVTGYLRGLNGNGTDTPNTRVPWAQTTCKATPSATADVVATCATKLALIPDLKGIVFSSDVLPPDYCAGKGKTDFELLRARIPTSGTAVVSKTTNDCQGVIFVPESEFLAQEVSGVSTWSLSLEAKSSATACTLKDPFCKIDRKLGTADAIDLYVVGEACRLTNASTGGTCF
ncbi:MAG: hypothetical protein HYV09_10415 [Deltaproteobacteria bacterium]|nr:hypothetical protein [Deltaproteobacteria bacterium]